MTQEEQFFRADDKSRADLQKMLDSPTMQRALAILALETRIRKLPEPRPHVHIDTLTSQQYARLLGRQEMLDKLRELARPYVEPPKESQQGNAEMWKGSAYFQGLPKAAQDAILAKAHEDPDFQPLI